jgi:hypothetical protein
VIIQLNNTIFCRLHSSSDIFQFQKAMHWRWQVDNWFTWYPKWYPRIPYLFGLQNKLSPQASVLFYYSMFYVMMRTWDFTMLFLFPKIIAKYWWTMTVYTLTAKTPNQESMAIENFAAHAILQLLVVIANN